jgi:chromosome segregation ATPase
MNPKHLTATELLRIVDGLDLGPVAMPWIAALASALEDDMGASEDAQAELKAAQERITELEDDNEDLTQRLDKSEDQVVSLGIDLEQVQRELEEYRRTTQDAI